jgi:ribosomal protein S18 acetylase RimI-like enzyme
LPAHLRPLRPADRAPLERLIRATDAFLEDEVAVAMELIDLGLELSAGKDHGYRFLVAEMDGEVVGYCCWGRTPCTQGTYDLYWVAVDARRQGHGVGRDLMRGAEAAARDEGGRQMFVETASKPSYAATRAFYDRIGYLEVARVPDFYAPGDDKVIYRYDLCQAQFRSPTP